MKKKYVKCQPMHNDIVVHCNHIDDTDAPHHFYQLPGAVLGRPNGSLFKPRWFICCDACHKASGYDILKVPFAADCHWQGNDPIIEP